MAKMSEGEHYYYLPNPHTKMDMCHIVRRDAPHPNFTVIVEQVSQDNASLIVDALNFSQDNIERFKLWKFDTQDGTQKPTF